MLVIVVAKSGIAHGSIHIQSRASKWQVVELKKVLHRTTDLRGCRGRVDTGLQRTSDEISSCTPSLTATSGEKRAGHPSGPLDES